MAANQTKVEPFAMLVFGRQGAGKTTSMEAFLAIHPYHTHIVYNPGREEDWQGYTEVRLKLDDKSKKLFFTLKGKDYDFDRHFVKKFKGGRVKVVHEGNTKVRIAFFSKIAYEKILPRSVLIIDDATNVIRHRLTNADSAIFSKTKHIGVKLILAYHDINYAPNEAFGLVTHIRQFITNGATGAAEQLYRRMPVLRTVDKNWAELQELPKYSYYTIDIYKNKNILVRGKRNKKK